MAAFPERPALRAFTWIGDRAGYETAGGHLARGVAPLLAPSSRDRRARWERVLAWYGLSNDTVVEEPRTASPTTHGTDLVVALHPDWDGPARLYAQAGGRPFLPVDGVEALQRSSVGKSEASLLLVGPPECFTLESTRALAERISVPWGLLTADDLPGLSFVVAKLLAGASPPRGDWPIIDIPEGTVRLVDESGRASAPVPLDPASLDRLVCASDWETLALFAHGEGGHVNLGSIVLCGLLGEEERARDGRPNGGCRVVGAVRHCKRAPDPATKVITFGDPRTRALHLFTCAGSLMGGELYPSNVSAVLSLAEGYPRLALVTDRIVPVHIHTPAVLLGLLRQRAGPGAVAHLQNDLEAYQSHCRPYLLFGDPAGPELSWLKADAAGELRLSANASVAAVRPGDRPLPTICGVQASEPGAKLARGAGSAAVLLPASAKGGAVRLVDEGARWASTRGWFVEVGRRVRRAAWVELAIRRMYELPLASSARFQHAAELMTELRVRLEEQIQRGLQGCEAARQSGAWDEILADCVEVCARQVGLWDRHFAILMADHLFSGLAYATFSDGFVVAERRSGPACDHCGTPLNESRLTAPLEDQPPRYRIECPLCGGREAWREGGGRVEVALSGPLHPGADARIEVCFSAPTVPPPAGLAPGVLVVHAQDKALRVFFRRIVEVTGEARRFVVEVPADLAPELHTLHLAWIHGLDGTVHRRRWLALAP